MAPVIALIAVLRVIWTINFVDLVYLMTGGGPGQSTLILPIEVYTTAFQAYRMSLAATMGTVMLVGLGVLAILYLKRQRWEAAS